jgi:signal transduction histidine kinase
MVAGRVIADRRTIHLHDLAAEPADAWRTARAIQRQTGQRTTLGTPMLRQGEAIGSIVIRRMQVEPFTEQQIAALQTFADQAVIAIENARLYRELEDKSAELAAASRHKSEFLANMSHELRTPLNAINGFSEVLIEQMFGELNERQLDYQRDILASGRHLLSLINDILDLSKVEAGRMELEISEFSLGEALQNGLTMLRERASRHAIALSLEIEEGLDLVEADERKVKQVVFNLLSNAVKFTPDGGRVEVTAHRNDREVRISVADTEVGISPEDLAHIFEEFRQVGRGTAKAEGTGLGLALAKRFVELHGGRIGVESERGTGTTFTFSLPLEPPATPGSSAAPRP